MRHVLALLLTLALADSATALGKYPPADTLPRRPGVAPPVVPEPAALAVFGVGAVIIGYALHRRRK